MKEESTFEIWQTIKSFYHEKFGISPELVDIAPSYDLLRLCASGASNESISKFFNEPVEVLMEIFDAHFGFMGWETDLKFSPLKLYKELDFPDEQTFKNNVIIKYGYLITHDLERMYESARLVERLERLFNEQWL